jgi:hypothetical protein
MPQLVWCVSILQRSIGKQKALPATLSICVNEGRGAFCFVLSSQAAVLDWDSLCSLETWRLSVVWLSGNGWYVREHHTAWSKYGTYSLKRPSTSSTYTRPHGATSQRIVIFKNSLVCDGWFILLIFCWTSSGVWAIFYTTFWKFSYSQLQANILTDYYFYFKISCDGCNRTQDRWI